MSDDDLKKAAAAAEVLAESAGIPLPNGEEWSYSMVATICLAIAMLLLAAREFYYSRRHSQREIASAVDEQDQDEYAERRRLARQTLGTDRLSGLTLSALAGSESGRAAQCVD